MKTILNLTAIASACILLTASCKKTKTPEPIDEAPVITTSLPGNSNIVAMFNDLATPLETFTVDLANGDYHTCNNGTRIFIRPNSFMYQDYTVATGIITIQTKDIRSKKDMILNNAFPVSNGQLLVSGGELYFDAKQGSIQLRPNPDYPPYVVMPPIGAIASTQMKLFIATGPSNLANGSLNWQPNNSNIILTATGPAGTVNNYGYDISFDDSIHWTNSDYFWNKPGTKTKCYVNLTGPDNNTNTLVFISMNGETVLTTLYPDTIVASQIFHSAVSSIPVGYTYTIGAIRFDGTNYFYSSQQATMTNDMIINMPALSPITKTQLTANLTALP